MGKRGPGAKPKKGKITRQEPALLSWMDTSLPMSERVVLFCESLPISSGKLAGHRVQLRKWQKDFLRPVYDRQEDGLRIVRTALMSIPRKNGKTQLCALLALAHLCGPCCEDRGQIYSAAADRNQAGLLFREMVAIIDRVGWMTDRLNIRNQLKTIEDMTTGSFYTALSADARKAHGLSPSLIIADEVAQWRGRELYDNLVTGTGAREQPLCFAIGTQSADDLSLMSELVDYAEQVNSGEVDDPSFHGVVYQAPQDADIWDETVWFECNPALDDFRSLKEMRQYAKQAKKVPTKEASFRNLYLNQRVDSEVRFISAPDWMACGEQVDPATLYGKRCYVGLDLASTQDLTAVVALFPDQGGAVLPFFFLPDDDLRGRSDRDRVPYSLWADQGLLDTFPGRAIDKRAVALKLVELMVEFEVVAIGFDRWRIEDLLKLLADDGITLPLVPWGQGFKDMAPAVDELEIRVLNGKLRHGNHPILTWNVANAAIEIDASGNRKLSKRRSREKIDGVVALAMACGLAARAQEEEPFNVENIMVFNL